MDVIKLIEIQSSTTERAVVDQGIPQTRESMYAENWVPAWMPDK